MVKKFNKTLKKTFQVVQKIRKSDSQLVAVIAFILGSFMVSGMLQSAYNPPSTKEVKQRLVLVKTKEIETSKHRISFNVSGIIESRNEIDIVPQVSGRVFKIHDQFFSGGSFRSGNTLFRVEPDDFQFEVSKKRAEFSSAKTAYELEVAESKAAIMEWKQERGDVAVPELVSRKLQLDEAKSKLRSAEAQLQNAQLNLRRTKFKLPFNGRVINSEIGVGQHIVAGQSYGRVFDKSSLEVKSSLSDNQLKWLFQGLSKAKSSKNGPKVTFVANYLGKQTEYEGFFKRGAASLDKNTRFSSVYFGFKSRVGNLIPGIFTNVTIQGPEVPGLMSLPLSALQNHNVVWMVENGLLVKWNPEIVYFDEKSLIVKSQNYEKVKVVTSRLVGGIEGMKVRTNEMKISKKQEEKEVEINPESGPKSGPKSGFESESLKKKMEGGDDK